MNLALICGTGTLPALVARAQDTRPLICALDGFEPQGLEPDITFRLEKLGTLLADLKGRGVDAVCLCGAISRPILDPGLIDAATAPLVPILKGAMARGDDGALRAVIGVFEEQGFTVRAAHELAPFLLPEPGVATIKTPGPGARADVQEALLALAEMGRRDLGQACVVRAGQVVLVEDERGTDALLGQLMTSVQPPVSGPDPLGWAMDTVSDMLEDTADWLSNRAPRPEGSGGILYKGPKPAQDRRADLPTIGPQTALSAAQAGLDGIVIEAGGVLVLDQHEVIRTLDRMGLFLWVRAR